MSGLSQIGQIDYTVIYARDFDAMRRFYEEVMGFPLTRTLSARWLEYKIGPTILALTTYGGRFDDPQLPPGALSVQLAFRVPPEAVAVCAEELQAKGVALESPVTDQPFGHRTVFFRDPDGNILEIYAEI
ncbi:VOC family protein [Oceanibaculum indicum]|uniref:Glyoxalase/bleomycin resistance protein/dioxygenase n=1 Tax=Oceanibaculum indicum P24 TaxID=1207063 RepID=K2JLX3_9PROT|nr:VOC family protein [Oceanibaculum indicum]EKE71514.1 Glyoxalase/bleomycin resistance protein/dioxygenase [Oceanibaculum indicum P24]